MINRLTSCFPSFRFGKSETALAIDSAPVADRPAPDSPKTGRYRQRALQEFPSIHFAHVKPRIH